MNIVVTGGTKGIGKAIARKFYQEGNDISICSRHRKDLDAVAEEFIGIHQDNHIHTSTVDVSNRGDIYRYAKEIQDTLGIVDILVNNAGIFIPGAIHEEEEGSLQKMIETNLYSAYNLSRALLPSMLKKKQGHIINMCSVASIQAYPNGGSYAISKFALLGFSKCLREELKEKGIKVTSILPGATWSASWEGVDLPESRLMQAKDIADTVYQLSQLSPSAVVEEIILRPQLGDL